MSAVPKGYPLRIPAICGLVLSAIIANPNMVATVRRIFTTSRVLIMLIFLSREIVGLGKANSKRHRLSEKIFLSRVL